ncbi:hypothetical protein M7I_6754 [Glarea lozoyensis 74030]|uniref:Uncharacterized protein n=1 Tax=Glarea lozoyensis (strain ATCC 74030 / MF5533) TaxID=1104152 RepID=H0EVF6_GLAL7|nr:hypothetical protein M7I_6754 [Glarea lozoyensis 74030]
MAKVLPPSNHETTNPGRHVLLTVKTMVRIGEFDLQPTVTVPILREFELNHEIFLFWKSEGVLGRCYIEVCHARRVYVGKKAIYPLCTGTL